METADLSRLAAAACNVRQGGPLVHCITNYVTVNDCANALLAVGGSPIMSDEVADVGDIQALCGGLVLNIGTLNERTIEGMRAALRVAQDAEHPVVLDPVGAGASRLRTQVASELLDAGVDVVRGNMSEIKALAGAAARARGVDVNPADVVTEENLSESIDFARTFAKKIETVVAITGAIDIVSDGAQTFVIGNGTPLMGRITGAGCMLTAVTGAFLVANQGNLCEATAAAVCTMGAAGQMAEARMQPVDGNGSFRTFLLDALCNINGAALEAIARVDVL